MGTSKKYNQITVLWSQSEHRINQTTLLKLTKEEAEQHAVDAYQVPGYRHSMDSIQWAALNYHVYW